MIIPKDMIDDIKYYQHTTKIVGGEIHDAFTLHFKNWWSFKKVILIRQHSRINGETRDFFQSASAAQLQELLENAMRVSYAPPTTTNGNIINAEGAFGDKNGK